ncbi:MAG: response regulator [Acidobacteriota bacterium]|nr:response regulator [Acidobacteriota bacterium]
MKDIALELRPTVYFIDDSATMREIVTAAFRRENINVVTCHDPSIALAEIELAPPSLVITDIIMPGKDGYEVCRFIKQHPRLKKMPVILVSGLVDRSVAEKALAVKADELIRKPFQPQDLVSRVKHLLNPGDAPASATAPGAPADKLRGEIQRLQGLVKKLQAELEAEREYGRALEAHIKTLQGSE